MNPLLPIVSWSWYLAPIYYFGTIPYWLIIMTINTILAQLIIKYDTKTLIFLLLLIAFPIAFQPVSQKIINNNNGFFYIQPTWNDNSLATASEKFYAISKKIDDIALANKTIHTIVMPEGSFGHDILVWQEYLDAWTGLLPATTSIIIGTHRRVGDALYNSLVQIQDGKIIGWYDKEHLMFFGERQPWIAQLFPSFKGLFGEHSFTYPCRNQSEIRIDGFIPMICSELFCKEKRPSCVDSPILFVCHDGWFTMHYAQDLALRAAQLYSLRYRVPIVYVGSNAMHFMQM